MTFKVPEDCRVKRGAFSTTSADGNNGAFIVPIPKQYLTKNEKQSPNLKTYTVIASDELGWEHVSVSLPKRCPTWDEMCFIKSLFWGDQDCVIQYHPPKSQYVNNHKYCLHLWRPTEMSLPVPAPILVGLI